MASLCKQPWVLTRVVLLGVVNFRQPGQRGRSTSIIVFVCGCRSNQLEDLSELKKLQCLPFLRAIVLTGESMQAAFCLTIIYESSILSSMLTPISYAGLGTAYTRVPIVYTLGYLLYTLGYFGYTHGYFVYTFGYLLYTLGYLVYTLYIPLDTLCILLDTLCIPLDTFCILLDTLCISLDTLCTCISLDTLRIPLDTL